MDRRPAARRGTAGGGTIPAIRAELAYLVTGLSAAALLAAVAGYAVLSAAAGSEPIAGAGVAGLLLLVAGVALGRSSPVYWGVGVVGATYVASLFFRAAALDEAGILVAVGLLGSAELASWSIDSRRRGRDDLTAHIHRLRGVALVLAAGIALASVVEAASSFGFGGSPATGVAAAAVVAGVVVTCLLAWKGAAART